MNKGELINAIAERTGFSKRDSEKALNAFMDIVSETLAEKDKVQLIGFGTFETKERAERIGHNPSTNEPMTIAGGIYPRFVPGKKLKDRVAK